MIKGVEAALFFKETDTDKVKISFRSIGKIDVREIAMNFGGGGHRLAAGAQLALSMNEAIEQVTEAVSAIIEKEIV